MIRIAVCDDDKKTITTMEERLLELSEKGNIKVRIETYSDGAFLLADIRKGVEFDLLYLDIEMEQLDGLSLAREFRKDHPNAVLIYISNHESYLKELFEVDTFRFLSKPINTEKFEAYFRNAVEKIQLQQEEIFFSYSYDRQFFKVLLSDIVYFESQKRSIRLYKKDGTEGSFYGKLNEVEKQLKEATVPFLRIHQSYLVNYNYIKQFGNTELELSNGKQLPISEDRRKTAEQKYGELLRKELFYE